MSSPKPTPKQIVRALFEQFTVGCNSPVCHNNECKSCKDFKYNFNNVNEAAKLAIDFAPHYLQHYCKSLQPTFFDSTLYDFADSFQQIFTELKKGNKDILEKEETKQIFNRAFSDLKTIMFLCYSKRDILLTEKDFNIDTDKYSDISDGLYDNFQYFEQYRKRFENSLDIFIQRFSYNWHETRFLIILSLFKNFLEDELGTPSENFQEIANLLIHAEDSPVKTFTERLADVPIAIGNFVKIAHTYITFYCLEHADASYRNIQDENIILARTFINMLREANYLNDDPLYSSSTFYNDMISKYLKLKMTTTKTIYLLELFTNSPIINIDTKYEILRAISMSARENYLQVGFRRQLFDPTAPNPVTVIELSRDNLINDTITQLSRIESERLKTKFEVKFQGEDAVDEGGVSREFYYLITAELFNPDFGMFKLIDNSTYWFNISSLEPSNTFSLLGKILGLAVYNSIFLPIRFPHVMYKKLLGETPTLHDLKDVDESVYNSLIQLRKMKAEGLNIADACIPFVATYENFGQKVEVELEEDGKNKIVTNDNLEDYIKLYVNWALNDSVKKFFEPFQRGFNVLCEESTFRMFTAEELEKIISGEQIYDWEALKFGTIYKGYTKDSATIKNFWEIFNELDEKSKISFLLFSTGSDKAPIGGLAHTKLIIQRGGDPTKLPVAHTCFNIFDLPDYPDKETMKKMLLISLQYAEGFGIK